MDSIRPSSTRKVSCTHLSKGPISSDDDLMKAIQEDHPTAFSCLKKRYYDRLYTFVNRTVHHHEETQDLLQEIFFRVYKYKDKYTNVASFSTWIHTIVLNLIRSRYRKYKTEEKSVVREGIERLSADVTLLQDQGLLQDQVVEDEDYFKSLNKALQSLQSEYRTALVLRDYLSLSYEEIAKKTGVPVGTVKSRINRARTNFQKSLLMEYCQKESNFSIVESSRALAK